MIRYSWDLGAALPPEAGTGDDEALAPGVRPTGDGDAPCAAPPISWPVRGAYLGKTLSAVGLFRVARAAARPTAHAAE